MPRWTKEDDEAFLDEAPIQISINNMPEQKQLNWKEEFNDKFGYCFHKGVQCDEITKANMEYFIQSLLSKALTEAEGEADICNEEMFYDENGIDRENGAKFYSNGYNAHRSHVSEVKKKYNL